MISVIIPVLSLTKMTRNLLSMITGNTIIPEEIILIDNGIRRSRDSSYDLVIMFPNLNIRYFKNGSNLGVNESWNIGFQLSRHELLSILNNDIEISNTFFEQIVECMKDMTVGIAVPNTKDTLLKLNKYKETIEGIGDITKTEGWAFTIRRSIFEKAYPIPRELIHNFGDNYLFFISLKLGYRNVKMLDNHIVHLGSVTGKFFDNIPVLEEQRKIWNEIKERLGSDV